MTKRAQKLNRMPENDRNPDQWKKLQKNENERKLPKHDTNG